MSVEYAGLFDLKDNSSMVHPSKELTTAITLQRSEERQAMEFIGICVDFGEDANPPTSDIEPIALTSL